MSEGCILWTAITKQLIGNKENNVKKTQVSVLEVKTCSLSHLQYNLQIFQNTYSSFSQLIIWVVQFFFLLRCMSLLYKLHMKLLPNMCIEFFFHSIGCHFNFNLLCRRFWVWCVLTSLFLQLLPLLLMTDLFEQLVFWKAILYQLFHLLLSSPILTKRHRLDEWIQNKIHTYAVYKRLTSVLETHTDWKWEDGKRYSMKMEIKRKLDWWFSYQEKIDLKIKIIIREKEWHYQMIKGQSKKKTKQF